MQEFTQAAKGLTKNPLGVIGLFIVLVYGFACLVLGFGASKLNPDERLPLIWFIVIFPIIILAVFFRLVTAHHKKLYAPSDYKDERNFLAEPLSEERRTERLESEIQRIQEQEAQLSSEQLRSISIDPESSKENASISNDLSSLEKPNPQIRSAPAIRSTYADAERLAFLELEKEIGKPFQKYVQLTAHGRTEEFDGVLITDHEAHLIEVKYFSRPMFKREFLEALIHRASSFVWDQLTDEKVNREKVIFWIAIVVDFPKESLPEFQKKVEASVMCNLFIVNLRFFHLDDLKSRYG